MIVCWLLSTLSPPIFGQVSHCITAYELWNCITQIFSQNSLARVLNLRAQLQNLKKGSMSVTDYIVKIKGIADMLMAAGQVLTERDIVTYILGGIGQEYDPVVASLTGKKEEVSVQETQFQLASFESRLEQFSSTANVDLSNASANIMRRIQKGDLPPNFKMNQFQQHFRGRFRGRGRGRGGRFYNNRAPCQLCGKLGHNASVCYHRYDQTGQNISNRFEQSAVGHNRFNNSSPQGNLAQQLDFTHDSGYSAYHPHNNSYNAMIASSSTIADPSWYVDSGATNHITPDFNNLSISNEYRGQIAEENTSTRGFERWTLPAHSPKS
ncbi:hypothetical protein ACOSQ2_026541 [Xanthoceras sorbifolium]